MSFPNTLNDTDRHRLRQRWTPVTGYALVILGSAAVWGAVALGAFTVL